jgi:hypothetical protein
MGHLGGMCLDARTRQGGCADPFPVPREVGHTSQHLVLGAQF